MDGGLIHSSTDHKNRTCGEDIRTEIRVMHSLAGDADGRIRFERRSLLQ